MRTNYVGLYRQCRDHVDSEYDIYVGADRKAAEFNKQIPENSLTHKQIYRH